MHMTCIRSYVHTAYAMCVYLSRREHAVRRHVLHAGDVRAQRPTDVLRAHGRRLELDELVRVRVRVRVTVTVRVRVRVGLGYGYGLVRGAPRTVSRSCTAKLSGCGSKARLSCCRMRLVSASRTVSHEHVSASSATASYWRCRYLSKTRYLHRLGLGLGLGLGGSRTGATGEGYPARTRPGRPVPRRTPRPSLKQREGVPL
jgi:hypothetical protein